MSKKRYTKRNSKGKKVRRERGSWLDDRQPISSGHYLAVHPALSRIECPDCGVVWTAPESQRRAGDGGTFAHAQTCPIGIGYQEASDDDRRWFAENPEAMERVRLPTMAELQAVMLVTGQAVPDMPNGGALEPGGFVTVTKLSDELRRRDFRNAMLLAAPMLSTADGYHPDEFDETGQLWFREHLAPGETNNDDEMWQW